MTTTLNASTAGAGGFIATSDNSGVLALQTAGTTAITVDASQNVGIGTTSPDSSNKLQVTGDIGLTWATDKFIGMKFGAGTSYKMGLVLKDSTRECKVWSQSSDSDDKITFYTGSTPSERMRIDSSGSLLVGTTNSNSNTFKFKVQAATNVCVGLASATDISGALTFNCINDANSANVPVDFRCNGFYISNGLATGAGTNAVKFNTSTKQLTYDTSSARYKNNIRDSIYGLDHVMQMRSAQFEYKDTGNSDVGLIAEEMQPIIPELVGLNEEGLADSVSYDRMVSVLVKAIQEQQTLITAQAETINALTARIVAIESRGTV